MKLTVQKSTTLVTDAFEFSEETTATLTDFPMPSGTEPMAVEDFLKLPTFPLNRAVEDRARKIAPLLTKPMPTHVCVKAIRYTGPTVKEPGLFKNNQLYMLDGHTRSYLWATHLRGNVVSRNTTWIPVPKFVQCTIYETNDPWEALALYNTIDSPDSVETSANKITGVLRAVNMLDKVKNLKIKKGQITGLLKYGAPFGSKNIYQIPGVQNAIDQMNLIKEPLTYMDKLDVCGKGHFHVQVTMGIAVAAGIAMDCDSKWIDAVHQLASVDIKKYDGHLSDPILNALVLGNCTNVLGIHNAMPYDIGIGQNPHIVTNYLSYLWLRLIEDDYDDDFDVYSLTELDINNSYLKLLGRAYEGDKE